MVTPRYGEFDASTPEARKAIHEQNRRSWNEATKAHNSHKADQAKFFREGGNKLYVEEFELLGDLRGQVRPASSVQLRPGHALDQAARRRASPGVDISDEAIDFARGSPAIPASRRRSTEPTSTTGSRKRPERRAVGHRLLLLRRDHLALRPRHVGQGHRVGPEAGRALRDRRIPPGRDDVRRGVPAQAPVFHPRQADHVGRRRWRLRGAVRTADAPSGWLDGVQDFQNPEIVARVRLGCERDHHGAPRGRPGPRALPRV